MYVIFNNKETMFNMMLIILSFSLLMKAFDTIEIWAVSNHNAKKTSISKLITFFIISVFKLIIVFYKLDIVYLAISFFLEITINALLFIYVYNKNRDGAKSQLFDKILAKSILHYSKFMILSSIAITLYNRIDQIMLGALLPNLEELGYYTAALNLSTIWYFVPLAVLASFKPLIFSEEESTSNHYLNITYSLTLLLGLFFVVFLSLFSSFIVLAIYGEKFMMSAYLFRIVLWGGLFGIIGNAASSWVIRNNLVRKSLYFQIIGLFINVLLNYILIPKYSAVGASVATVVTQMVINILLPLFDTQYRSNVIRVIISPIYLCKIVYKVFKYAK